MTKEEKREKTMREVIEGKLDAYGMTKRSLYSIVSIFGCLLLTIVMSITGTAFDPAVFTSWSYWVSLIIEFAISIFSMITGNQIGTDTQTNKPEGQYRRELGKYKVEYDSIVNGGMFEYFGKWLSDYRERKREERIMGILRDWHIAQPAVLDLDLCELECLKEPYKKDWTGTQFYDKYYRKDKGDSATIFKSLSDEQIEVVRQIMQGRVQVPNIDTSYFLNALDGTSVDGWSRAAKSNKKKSLKVASGYGYRLIMMLAISIALNGLLPAPYGENSGATIALNIARRIFTLVSSVVWGIFMGFKLVSMEVVYLGYKTFILKTYATEFASGAFKPESVEQEAEREYEEAKKKEVQVEIVTPPDETPLLGMPIEDKKE